MVLRRLGTSYLEEAWAHTAVTLADFGFDLRRSHWGACHPGVSGRIDGTPCEDSPSAGVGWLLAETQSLPTGAAGFPPPWPDLDAALGANEPSLCLLYDHYRAQRATLPGDVPIDPSDSTTGLELLLALMLDDVSDWRGRREQGVGAWMWMANAIASGREAAFTDAVLEAHRQYTEVGMRLCLEGFNAFLFQRVLDSWSPTD